MRIWDVDQGGEWGRQPGHSDRIVRVAYSEDGKRVFTWGRDRAVRVWGGRTGDLYLIALEGPA